MPLQVHARASATALAPTVLFAVFLAACTVGPDYVPPDPPMPAHWQEISTGVTAEPAALGRWWTLFDDPLLDQLVEEAIGGNLPLQEASQRVEESRARYRVVAAALLPQIDLQSGASRNLESENGPFFGGDEFSDFSVGLAASWELDLFGRVRRAVESSSALEDAARENQRDVMVVLCAEVGSSYINLRTLQQRLAVAHANLTSQEEISGLTQVRFELGLASGLDVAQADQVLATTRTLIPPLELALTEEINRLGVLLGEQPGALRERLAAAVPIPDPPEEVAVGLPIDLLRQRPDLRRAERELAAQNARIGVAVGDLYPRFSLLGSIGLDATQAADLFEGASRMYGVGPTMIWNVFDAGRLRAQIWAEQSLTEQALLRYQQQLLVALAEVENALAAYERTREQRVAVADAVAASALSLDLATTLYKDGAVDFQNVLDAQRTLLVQEEQLAITNGAVVQSLVRLYLALGGGWDPDTQLDGELNAQG